MFEQYKLPYAYDALEPAIDALTMETHYSKHHATYTATLNTLAEKAGVQDTEITSLLANLSKIGDEAIRNGIRNNGGGYYNHNLYFKIISPRGGGEPIGALKAKMDATFGSFDAFKEKITALATGQFGSGWAWMSVTPAGELVLSNSANQDNPISQGTGNTPIFGVDVWEHAYYLKYKNLRAAYVKEFFNVVDWNAVNALYEAAAK
ncbi:MAG: superoxide dismutase [Lachnospiraceae bacterium]|nr:superoxide dismutase [Lachnospiraceae bacterium]